jgi:hypothetical protein
MLTKKYFQEDPAQIFLPRRYSVITTDGDIAKINKNAVSLNLVYMGDCAKSKTYQLAIDN